MKLPKHLHELINSGITLTDKEAAAVEEYLFSIQQPMTRYQLNSAVGRVACGLNPSFIGG